MVSDLRALVVSSTFHMQGLIDLQGWGRLNNKTFVFCIEGLDRVGLFAFRLPWETSQEMLLHENRIHCVLQMEIGCLLEILLCLLLFLLNFLEWNFHHRKNILCLLSISFFQKYLLLFNFVFLLVFENQGLDHFGKV